MVGMASELEKIEEVKKYIEATIAEIDSHTENMEKLFKMDKWSRDRELYEIIINSYERHRNTLKRIQKMVEGGKVESGLYTLSTKSEIDMVKERIEKLENDLVKKHMEDSESKLSDSEILDGFSEIKSSVIGHDQTGVVIYPSSSGPEILVGHSNFESTVEETSFIQGYRVEGNRIVETRRIRTNLSSVGALCMADIDGDGDLDLFAGGRTVPGRYPEPASSMLFINDSGAFVPDSKNSAHLEEIGLITGALFSDIDSDNDPDLILAMEWGPVTILENEGGTFSNATASYGLSDYVGWWNGVATGDFNEDGRLDIVATNWGLNTKYHISEDHPLELYYDDFDRNGTLDIVEGHWDEGMDAMVPERGLSCMSNGIGYVGMRVPTFKRFGQSNLEEIVGPVLNDAPRLQATVLEHMLFMSGSDGFTATPLQAETQFSPAFGAVVADMDGDSHEDIFLSQNFFAYQIETSRSDAGRGLWLRGDGTGVLTPVPGQESGIEVYGEQRGAAAADFDGDGRIDLVVSQNGAPTKMYRNISAKPGLRLENLVTVGAKVRVLYKDGTAGPIREIQVGSSYWSQNGASTLGSRKKVKTVVIEWPDGSKSQLAASDSENVVIVRRN